MFAFLCPIRHPKSSNNYDEVLKYLALTIESITNQKTSEDYVFMVVCNEQPDIPGIDKEKIKFLAVDFPPPDNNIGSNVSLDAVKKDKGTKVAAGLLELKKYAPDYVYIMDGDDWFNINIIESIKNKKADLWYANSGYVVNFDKKTYIKKYGMCRYCGSTYIYKYKSLFDMSGLGKISENEMTYNNIIDFIDDFFMKNILGNHRHQLNYFIKKEMSVKETSLPVVAWILNTGENHSQQNPGSQGIPISNSLLSDFGVKSIAVRRNKLSLVNLFSAYLQTIKSYIGWYRTDKTADKI